MSEYLTDYLLEAGIKAAYLHSDIASFERIQILQKLRTGEADVLVGINLLREGLDLPEVSLVAILDADKEGFLRSRVSLIQTMGRAARNVDGKVILYADKITNSIKESVSEVNRRRKIQRAYNEKHKIIPKTIIKGLETVLDVLKKDKLEKLGIKVDLSAKEMKTQELITFMEELETAMKSAANKLEFELAAELRDKIAELKEKMLYGKDD